MADLRIRIPESASLAAACAAFLDETGRWVRDCIDRYADAPPTDGHDQMTFTTAWVPYIRARRDERALAFMKRMRDRIADHFHQTAAWRHGYWRMQEAHHGTEHFELFLGTLTDLDDADRRTGDQLFDAAEHLANLAPAVDDWFDRPSGLFRSTHFGADGIRDEPACRLNLPDHFRCVNVALLAAKWKMRLVFLDVATRHGRQWAEAICRGEQLPLALSPEGPIYGFSTEAGRTYHQWAGQAMPQDSPVNRAENLLASGAVEGLLRLANEAKTGRDLFLAAARRLLDVLATQLADPDAGAAAAALRTHRLFTGDDRYDAALLGAVNPLQPYGFTELSLDPQVSRPQRPSGIGKRSDMPLWFEDGRPRRHNPILLAAAAEITADQRLACRAVDLARAYFHLARQAYPDGRDHGCSARSVSAIARGHGRDNNAGVVTAVLAPLMARFHVAAE